MNDIYDIPAQQAMARTTHKAQLRIGTINQSHHRGPQWPSTRSACTLQSLGVFLWHCNRSTACSHCWAIGKTEPSQRQKNHHRSHHKGLAREAQNKSIMVQKQLQADDLHQVAKPQKQNPCKVHKNVVTLFPNHLASMGTPCQTIPSICRTAVSELLPALLAMHFLMYGIHCYVLLVVPRAGWIAGHPTAAAAIGYSGAHVTRESHALGSACGVGGSRQNSTCIQRGALDIAPQPNSEPIQ